MIRKIASGLAIMFSGLSVSAHAADIGIHIAIDNALVTATTTQQQLREQMEAFIFELNEYYDDSNIDLRGVTENVEFIDISNNGQLTNATTILNNIGNEVGDFQGVFNDADRFGADYIVAIVGSLSGVCGQAMAVNTTQANISTTRRAYAVSRLDCDADTFAHELGHLMGLAHGNRVATCLSNNAHMTALTPYARGWAEGNCNQANDQDEFGTIMVGNWLYLVTGWGNINNFKVPLFSSPNLTHATCGADDNCGDAANGDAARALNENRNTYSAHEARDVDLLNYSDARFQNCLSSNYREAEVATLNNLNCSNYNISSIFGLEQLANLRQIDLSNNRIVNLSPLDTFSPAAITNINLSGNDTALCHQLDRLQQRYPGVISVPDKCFNIGAMIAALAII